MDNVEDALKAACAVLNLKGQSQPEILSRIQKLVVEEYDWGATVYLLWLKSKPGDRMQRSQFLQTLPPAIRCL